MAKLTIFFCLFFTSTPAEKHVYAIHVTVTAIRAFLADYFARAPENGSAEGVGSKSAGGRARGGPSNFRNPNASGGLLIRFARPFDRATTRPLRRLVCGRTCEKIRRTKKPQKKK